MKKVFSFIATFFIFIGISGVATSQEIKIEGPLNTALKGGYKFNNIRVPYEDCTAFFLTPSNSPVPYEDIFDSTTTLTFASLYGAHAQFSADIVKRDVYYTKNFGYKILPDAAEYPKFDINIPSGSDSILKNIIFIPEQTGSFVNRSFLLGSHVDSFETVMKVRQVERPDGSIETEEYEGKTVIYPYQSLTLLGFFYLLQGDYNLERLCTMLQIPFVRTTDNLILIPVGGKKQGATRWMLQAFYGIGGKNIGRYVSSGFYRMEDKAR